MGIYAEALILYILVFFSGSAAVFAGAALPRAFSSIGEITKMLLHIIPSLALIWYLIHRSMMTDVKLVRGNYIQASTLKVRFGLKDLISAAYALPCLLAAGFTVSLVSSFTSAYSETSGAAVNAIIHLPVTNTEWSILCVSCMLSAYLEESYFRFYLLTRREELGLRVSGALVLSIILFSVCHIYGGPWSFLNAVISGAVLGFIFLRYNAIHGLAIAHGLYNISVYAVYAMINY